MTISYSYHIILRSSSSQRFFRIAGNIIKETPVLVSLFNKVAVRPANLLKRVSNANVFLWICDIFKNSLFHRTPLVAASNSYNPVTSEMTNSNICLQLKLTAFTSWRKIKSVLNSGMWYNIIPGNNDLFKVICN